MDVFVARQPIFNTSKKIHAYELLFREGFKNTFPDIDGTTATSSLLSNVFFSINLRKLIGKFPAFINFTHELILKKTPLLFKERDIIVEVLEDIEPEPAIIDALNEIRQNNFIIALDDFVYHERFKPLISLCHIIKFDIMATPLETLDEIVKNLKENTNITLLAEKVETYEEFEQAKKMGFTLFQGYFFAKPEVLSGKDISSAQSSKLLLINEINKTELDLKKVHDAIKNDISVSYKLLKFINSAFFKRTTSLDTIKDAVTFLGEDELRKFIQVVVLSDLGDQKPNELIRNSLIRARMCELCADLFSSPYSGDELFILGLFSMMDAILDMEMEDILDHLAISSSIKAALMGHNQDFNKILNVVISFEKADWNSIYLDVLSGTPIEKKLPEIYYDAVNMTNALI